MSTHLRVCSLLFAGLVALLPGGAHAQQPRSWAAATAQAFQNVGRIETQLRRGISTQEDVRRLLGVPTGNGGALFPTMTRTDQVWSYENVEMELVGSSNDPTPAVKAKQRWEVILIFFDGNIYDGFMWFTSGAETAAAVR